MLASEGNPENPRPVLPLAELAENSPQGFTAKKINSHRGWSEVKFKTVTGIGVSLRREGIRPRCQSLNRYAYALNNPTTLTDPSGLGPPGCNPLPSPQGGYFPGDKGCVVTQPPTFVNVTGIAPPDTGLLNIQFGQQWATSVSYNTPNFTVGGVFDGPANLPGAAVRSQPTSQAQPCSGAGHAPSPSYYQTQGLSAYLFRNMPAPGPGGGLVTGLFGAGQNVLSLYSFRRGGSMDAQAYGASPAYGIYAFGVYMSAAGYSLSLTLSAANAYGALFSNYRWGAQQQPDKTYTHIPAANVTNITNGYDAEQNGTLCSPY